ncbi:flagellar basal-body rod protein FlgG [Lichenibacterium dinghuense]|uniref:flagellar basal-body rod protein FlgG n=1 Tax=Lichenibacterium dinghuense TaxID=2895977 RepID=UPI001F0095FC|nr:flagellar basal-body rod protein FlgG [Lichenibacterium sp. 6Y81]
MRALAIAATGMSAQQTNVEVIANNLANINTTGFKRGKAEFSDLMYEAERLQGVSNRGSGNTIPEGAQLGLGVRMAAIRNLQTQGSFTNTGNTFDLGIQGRGWFQLTGPNGDTVYTRAGAFNTNASGQLVSLDGYAVSPSIIVPPNSTNVTISSTGIVTCTVNGATTPTQLGQLTLANFANETGLDHLGSNMFRETAASGTAVVGVPGDPSIGTISQGYLEASNVDPVKEISDLISAQRAYEMNSKVIQACDQMGSTLTTGTRG